MCWPGSVLGVRNIKERAKWSLLQDRHADLQTANSRVRWSKGHTGGHAARRRAWSALDRAEQHLRAANSRLVFSRIHRNVSGNMGPDL